MVWVDPPTDTLESPLPGSRVSGPPHPGPPRWSLHLPVGTPLPGLVTQHGCVPEQRPTLSWPHKEKVGCQRDHWAGVRTGADPAHTAGHPHHQRPSVRAVTPQQTLPVICPCLGAGTPENMGIWASGTSSARRWWVGWRSSRAGCGGEASERSTGLVGSRPSVRLSPREMESSPRCGALGSRA